MTALLCLLLVPCFANAPLAGSTIINRAEVTYQDSASGIFSRLSSNTVRVTVAPLEGLSLTADRNAKRDPGSQVYFPHRILNTGNTTSTYKLTYSNLGGDDFDLDSLRLAQDINSSGVIDSGEPLLPNGSSITLAPGAWMDLVLAGAVPNSTGLTRTSRVTISAVSALQSVTEVNNDTVITSGGPSIGLSLRASNMTPSRADDETFTITGVNTGTGPATPIDITIDGSSVHLRNSASGPARYAIVRDVIPANTTFVSITEINASLPLYHVIGAGFHDYISSPPSDLSTVDAVAYGFPIIAVNQSFNVSFKVKINMNASGHIVDIATVYAEDSITPISVDSSVVLIPLSGFSPDLHYYTNNAFASIATLTLVGSPLYLQGSAAACNLDPLVAETHPIRIVSNRLGDTETFTAAETGPNTGIFRILPSAATANGDTTGAIPGNNLVETVDGDVLFASIEGCGSGSVTTSIVVNPMGIVFDSSTNKPIAGAQVELIDITGQGNGGSAGAPAKVLNPDGSVAPSTLTTSADGRFRFAVVADSTYRVNVTPPNGFSFASQRMPTLLPADRNIDLNGSYGKNFPVNLGTGPIHFDIPLDPASASGLFVQKEALRAYVEIGDFVDYQVKIKNSSGVNMTSVVLHDTLPAGFAYQSATARLMGARMADPDGGAGPFLNFHLGTIAAAQEVILTYRVKVGPSAASGDALNHAYAQSGPSTSNVATAVVKLLQTGAFSDRGYVMGNVFADCNGNRLRDRGEHGVPGVRVYLEDGTFAITDPDGSYSIYGIQPTTHVLKVDNATLPANAALEVLSNRQAMRAGTRFLDMKDASLEKADFALAGCSSDLADAIETRRVKSNDRRQETNVALQQKTQVDPIRRSAGDLKSSPSSGIIVENVPQNGTVLLKEAKPGAAATDNKTSKLSQAKAVVSKLVDGDAVAIAPGSAAPKKSLPQPSAGSEGDEHPSSIPADIDDSIGFIGIKDGAVMPGTQINIRVKGRQSAIFHLKVNGTDIPGTRVGAKTVVSDRRIEVWEFIGIALTPGDNTIVASAVDSFGNARESSTARVIAPDKLASIKVVGPDHLQAIDDPAPVRFTIFLADVKGVPVTSRTPITLETSNGEWRLDDLNPKEPGTQIFVEGGKAELSFRPPTDVGAIKMRASSGTVSQETKVDMTPALRPMIALGLLDFKLDLRSLDSRRLDPTQGNDGFEQALGSLTADSSSGKLDFGAHTALMMKGKVRGDYLMTAAFDSSKNNKDQLFRDIQPDEFYPVYGDGSVRGYDAQSSGKAYLRFDKGKNYFLYGDFTTQPDQTLSLSGYNRSFSGFKQHFENDHVGFTGWASYDSLTQVVEELAGNGTSGPYLVRSSNAVQNSEKVEIITRDRNQPAIVLHSESLARFSDYAFEPYTGRLLFKAPIASRDAFLNPIFIRVSYEVDGGGQKYWVSGVDGHYRFGKRIELGANFVTDQKPGDEFQMMGFNTVIHFAPKTKLIGEFAQTDRELIGSGIGYRVEFQHEDGRMQLRFFTGQTDPTFDNPTALLARGRGETGGKFTLRLLKHTRLVGEALRSVDQTNNGARTGIQVAVEQSLPGNMIAQVGFVHARESVNPAQANSVGTTPNGFDSLQAKFTAPVPHIPNATMVAEYQQDLTDADRKMLALGGRYQISERTRAYVRHEFISSFGGMFALNTSQSQNSTVFGVESDTVRSSHLFGEYRAREAFSGREAEAAVGLRNTWIVGKGVRVNSSLESVRDVQGVANTDALAITGGVEFTSSEVWKGSARMEWRGSNTNHSILNTVGLATKLSTDWTLLGRNIMANSTSKNNTGDRLQDRAQIGVAFRDHTSNRWNALAMFEYKVESDSTTPALAFDRSVAIFSTHFSYQPSEPLQLSAHYAGKLVLDDTDLSSRSVTHLTSFRATYDLSKRFDAGLVANTLFTGWNSMQYGLGGELGYLIAPNLWLSAGYNVTGFRDRDLGAEDYTKRGIYLRMRFKFDEGLLGKGMLGKVFGR